MATDQRCVVVTLAAGEDLTGDIYEVVKLNASGQVIKTAAATDIPIGVIAADPGVATVGVAVAVAILGGGGVLKMKAGAAITAGQVVVLDGTAGRVAGVANIAGITNDSLMLGFALDAAADGEILRVLAQQGIA